MLRDVCQVYSSTDKVSKDEEEIMVCFLYKICEKFIYIVYNNNKLKKKEKNCRKYVLKKAVDFGRNAHLLTK